MKKNKILVDFPLNINKKKFAKNEEFQNNDYIYELYAISNHLNEIEKGHYTAFCKNSDANK